MRPQPLLRRVLPFQSGVAVIACWVLCHRTLVDGLRADRHLEIQRDLAFQDNGALFLDRQRLVGASDA